MTRAMIDTHCHLNLPPLDEDPPAVLARAARLHHTHTSKHRKRT